MTQVIEDFFEFPRKRFMRISRIDAWAVMPREDEWDEETGDIIHTYRHEIQIFMNGQDEPFKFYGDEAYVVEEILSSNMSVAPLEIDQE